MYSLITLDLRKEDEIYDDGEMLGCILRFHCNFWLTWTTTVHVTYTRKWNIWNTVSIMIQVNSPSKGAHNDI